MIPRLFLAVTIIALAVVAGCDSNPEGPRAPSAPQSSGADTPRQPVTKNAKEIVNPD